MAAVLLAISLGLCGGYLDLTVSLFKKLCLNSEGYFRNAADSAWTIPVGHAVLLFVPGVLVAAVNRRWPAAISLRAATWLFATLAIWGALMRLPLYAVCTLLLALGAGRLISDAVVALGQRPRRFPLVFATVLGVLGVLAALSTGWQAIGEYRAAAALPPAPSRARNVVMIVWDTVRIYDLGFYGYHRATTPNLERWAQNGVAYKYALAPAPWTFPSHSCFFTGQWPFRLNSQWKFTLDAACPTLAEYLTTQGYQTAGFVANTNCCSYETGLARGFAHFADYALTPQSLLTRTVPGKWLAKNLLNFGDYYDEKWIELQSRGAREINNEFFGWLGGRRADRPFFAFLNYFDAHEPFVPPAGYGRFGIRPKSTRDYRLLMDFVGLDKDSLSDRDIVMARDCYDDCIAFLDEQLGRLLDTLKGQGLLENTDVIITSDHGEAFGDHGILGHSYSVNFDEIGVPLVILSPTVPSGRVVNDPVSLRDLPATVVDLLGLSADSPFPGRSLVAYWKLAPGQSAPPGFTSPAFSEQANSSAFASQPDEGRKHHGFEMSLVASGYHYVRDGMGAEQLYDLKIDPYEKRDLIELASSSAEVARFRKMLLDVLTDNPGSFEVENAYLTIYRRWLEDVVQGSSTQPFAANN
jgi:arylsulfatase A-like enzyme